MTFDEVEILRKRAEAFLRNAEHLMNEGELDLAAFNMEQYCQLILKYKLLIKTGSYPRTHILRDLIRQLTQYSPEVEALLREETNLLFVTKLEDAYIVSRYLPRRYDETEVSSVMRFIKGVLKPIVDRV